MTFDQEDRLVAHSIGSNLSTLTYNGVGQLKIRSDQNGLTTYVYDEEGALLQARATYNALAAQFVSQTIPSTLPHGQVATITLEFANLGGSTWETTFSADCLEGANWGFTSSPLSSSVPTGAIATFSFLVTAPSSPGAYPMRWQMASTLSSFGEISPLQVILVH